MRGFICGAAVLFAFAMAGCVGTGTVDPGESGPAPDHTYYAEPDTIRVSLFEGTVEGGTFRQDLLTVVSFIGTSEDGFVFGETHAGTTLAVNQIEVLRNKDALTGRFYNPCGGARALVFTAPAEKSSIWGISTSPM